MRRSKFAVFAIGTDDTPQVRVPLLIGLASVLHGRSLRVEASADGQTWTATLTEP